MGLSRVIRELACAGAGLVVALLLVEVPALVGFVDYRNVDWLSPDRLDPVLSKIHRPHLQLRGSARGGLFASNYRIPEPEMSLYRWDVRYDRHGFRNDVDLDRADIAVQGASYVEAVTIPSAQLTTTLLAQETGSVVANLGQNNFSLQQDLVVLQRYGLPLGPKVVVWMLAGFTDLRQVLYYRGVTSPHPPLGFWQEFRRRSFVTFARSQLHPYLHRDPRPDGSKQSGLVPDAQHRMIRIYFLHPGEPLSPYSLSAVEDARMILAQAYNRIAAQGSRMLVVFIPEPFRVFQPFAQFDADSPCRGWIVNDEPQRLEAAVHSVSSEIGFLDLTGVMREAVSRGIIPYFTDDNHWTPAGHEIAARTIQAYLARAGFDAPARSQ